MAKLDNPQAAAQAWADRMGTARQAYIDGANGVKVAPGQLAAASGDRWANNTVASKPRYVANSAKVTKEQWVAAVTNKGADRLASGAAASKDKVALVFAKLFPAINSIVGSLPPRGDINQNIERSRKLALELNKMRGTFK